MENKAPKIKSILHDGPVSKINSDPKIAANFLGESAAQHINYFGNDEECVESNIAFQSRVYYISEINTLNKHSHGYFNCMGVAMIGVSKDSGDQLSLLSHQAPCQTLKKTHRGAFENALTERVSHMLSSCEQGSVDCVIFGGERVTRTRQHIDFVKQLDQVLSKTIGKSPIFIHGPNCGGAQDDAYLDTQEGILHLVRQQQIDAIDVCANESFLACEIDAMTEKWQKKVGFVLKD